MSGRASIGAKSAEPDRAQFNGGGGDCTLEFSASFLLGPNQGTSWTGNFSISISDDGAIENGQFVDQDGETWAVAGQAIGRTIRLRIDAGEGKGIALIGSGLQDASACDGDFFGSFAGPDDQDVGSWQASGQGTQT